jgi:lipoprotein-anchoring transpeptidase ErfK/SrfK
MKNFLKPTPVISLSVVIFLFSCNGESTMKKNRTLNYDKLFEKVKKDSTALTSDSTNIFDGNEFDPTKDSIEKILTLLENDLREDSTQIEKTGITGNDILSNPAEVDTVNIYSENGTLKKDSFTNEIKKITTSEIKTLKYNLEQLKNKPIPVADSNKNKTQINARVWARISKQKQLLKLYIDGELVDSFKVSSGDKKHETPAFDLRPSGPIFNKYTSKKFPGGNYNGLGNMPYVVFIKGGFAVHGTTKGNIPKLGKKASHGCVRLHPDNAKIFNEVVKALGIENTWVTITEGE